MSAATVFTPACPPSPADFQNPPYSNLYITFQCLAGQSYITNLTLPLKSHDPYLSGESCYIAAIHQQLQHFKAHECILSRTFGKHHLGFADVVHSLPLDPRSSCACCRVYLSDFKYHWLLTKVVFNPHHQLAATASTIGLEELCMTLKKGFRQSDKDFALVVRRVIDKARVVWLVGSLAALAPLASIFWGICSHKIESAIALFIGILALAGFVQTFVSYLSGITCP